MGKWRKGKGGLNEEKVEGLRMGKGGTAKGGEKRDG